MTAKAQNERAELLKLIPKVELKNFASYCHRITSERPNTTQKTAQSHRADLKNLLDRYHGALDAYNIYTAAYNVVRTSRTDLPIFLEGDEQEMLDVVEEDYISIANPESFELHRIRNMHANAHRYNPEGVEIGVQSIGVYIKDGDVSCVSIQLRNGPVDDITITDPKIFRHLGLCATSQNLDTIKWNIDQNHVYPSFILVEDDEEDENGRTSGELILPPRHSYLFWLDLLQERYPEKAPTLNDSLALQHLIGFYSAEELLDELTATWNLEQGELGDQLRASRSNWLGEDPVYDEM